MPDSSRSAVSAAGVPRRRFLELGGLGAVVTAMMAAGVGAATATPLGGYPPIPAPVRPIFERLRTSSTQALTGVMVMQMPAPIGTRGNSD